MMWFDIFIFFWTSVRRSYQIPTSQRFRVRLLLVLFLQELFVVHQVHFLVVQILQTPDGLSLGGRRLGRGFLGEGEESGRSGHKVRSSATDLDESERALEGQGRLDLVERIGLELRGLSYAGQPGEFECGEEFVFCDKSLGVRIVVGRPDGLNQADVGTGRTQVYDLAQQIHVVLNGLRRTETGIHLIKRSRAVTP